MSRVAIVGVILFLAGIGTFLLGLLVVGYKCLRWLHDGFWTSTDIRTAWFWTGSKPPVTGELGLDKILAWILDQPLELGLIVGGLIVLFVSAPFDGPMNASETMNASEIEKLAKKVWEAQLIN